MVPLGLLVIIALGLVVAYVLPQRIKERADYALVRTEDRYSAQMRVVRSSAERIERAATRPSTDSGEVPLLTTGASRAQLASDRASSASSQRAESMSRPAGPLDRAATFAQRESWHLRRDRSEILAERAAQARRRLTVASVVLALTVVGWSLVAFAGMSAVIGAVITAVFVAVVAQGARAAAAQRRADERVLLVAREVEAAATATQALRVVSRERAAGRQAEPSDVATQAIRIVTAEDLAPLAAPAPVPAPELPAQEAQPAPEESAGWSPSEMPAPSYTLKATVRQREARPISADDYDAARARAARWGESEDGATQPAEAPTATAALDAILARRRHSA